MKLNVLFYWTLVTVSYSLSHDDKVSCSFKYYKFFFEVFRHLFTNIRINGFIYNKEQMNSEKTSVLQL